MNFYKCVHADNNFNYLEVRAIPYLFKLSQERYYGVPSSKVFKST